MTTILTIIVISIIIKLRKINIIRRKKELVLKGYKILNRQLRKILREVSKETKDGIIIITDTVIGKELERDAGGAFYLRSTNSIYCTKTMMDLLSIKEFNAVIDHEKGHQRNLDSGLSSIKNTIILPEIRADYNSVKNNKARYMLLGLMKAYRNSLTTGSIVFYNTIIKKMFKKTTIFKFLLKLLVFPVVLVVFIINIIDPMVVLLFPRIILLLGYICVGK